MDEEVVNIRKTIKVLHVKFFPRKLTCKPNQTKFGTCVYLKCEQVSGDKN